MSATVDMYSPVMVTAVAPTPTPVNVAAIEDWGGKMASRLLPAQQKETILPDKFTPTCVPPTYHRY